MRKIKTNTQGIGAVVTIERLKMSIIDRAPERGTMWAVDDEGRYYKIRPASEKRDAEIVEAPMSASRGPAI